MRIVLYSFSKRENSTRQPTIQTTQREFSDIRLKDASSIVTPAIELQLGNTASPEQYNYAYIPDFHRYYWINNWVYYRGIWTAYLNVDALATWRSQIGASTQYVLRSAAEYDGEISDNFYALRGNVITENTDIQSLWTYAGSDMNKYGRYVIGVMGNSATTYYMMTPKAFYAFIKGLFSDDFVQSFTTTITTSAGEILTGMNPLSYISSIRWYARNIELGTVGYDPDGVQGVDYRATITVGYGTVVLANFDSTLGNDECVGIHQQYADYATNYVLPKHPQTATRGNYVNREEFTSIHLFYPPWGVVTLSPDIVSYADAVRLHIIVDYRTGNAFLRVFAFEDNEETTVLCNSEATVGVDCAISANTNTLPSLGSNIMSGAKVVVGAVKSIVQVGAAIATAGASAAGGLAEATMADAAKATMAAGSKGAFSGAEDAISEAWAWQGRREKGSISVLNSTGTDGAYASLVGNPHFTSLFYQALADDVEQRGRPLCQKRVLSGLHGYLIIADPDITLPATQLEHSTIKRAMASGFFYE